MLRPGRTAFSLIVVTILALAIALPALASEVGPDRDIGTSLSLAQSLFDLGPPEAKNAACDLYDPWGDYGSYSPTRDGCELGGGGCYQCAHSGGGLIWYCYESPDGQITFCLDVDDIPW